MGQETPLGLYVIGAPETNLKPLLTFLWWGFSFGCFERKTRANYARARTLDILKVCALSFLSLFKSTFQLGNCISLFDIIITI